MFVFLRNARATLIPSVAVPASLIGTFAVMYLLGYSLDNLSLMALTIATGFVVDDAIVVMENISRHLEAGMTPFEAALRGASEIGFTVLTISVSLVAVFIPILAMGGIVGRLFREFAVTLSVAIVISMVVSLTDDADDVRVPAARRAASSSQGRFFARLRARLRRDARRLPPQPALGARQPRRSCSSCCVLTIALNVVLVIRVPKGFFPQQDTGVIVRRRARPAGRLVRVDGRVGAGARRRRPSATRRSRTSTRSPARQRTASCSSRSSRSTSATPMRTQVIARLRGAARPAAGGVGVPAGRAGPADRRPASATRSTSTRSRPTRSQDLAKWGPLLLARMKKLPGFTDVSSDQQNGGLRRI